MRRFLPRCKQYVVFCSVGMSLPCVPEATSSGNESTFQFTPHTISSFPKQEGHDGPVTLT